MTVIQLPLSSCDYDSGKCINITICNVHYSVVARPEQKFYPLYF